MTWSRPESRFKQWAAEAVEAAWRISFRVLGRLLRSHAQPWSSPGGQRVLVVAPHPDDEAIGCAGTLMRHLSAGDTVCLVWVTDGRASRAANLAPAAMAEARQQESRKFARALGTSEFEWYGLPEGEWQPAELETRLSATLDRYQPHLVYAPSLVDFHPEHHQVARALAQAVSRAAASLPSVRAYAVQVPLTLALANVVANVSALSDRLASALDAYETQVANLPRAFRLRRYTAAWHGHGTLAEEFWELPAAQYAALHLPEALTAGSGRFRSLRFRPWADGLAFAFGQQARRRLAQGQRQARQEPEVAYIPPPVHP